MRNLLHDQIAEFLEDKQSKRSPATAAQYSFVLERVFAPWADSQGITKVDEMDYKAMDRFHLYLKGKTLAPATVVAYCRDARIFLKWFDVTLSSRYEAPKAPQMLRDVLHEADIDAMEKAAGDERDRIAIRLLWETGIRATELLGLRPEDLSEDKHNRQYGIRVIGKGNKQRDVPITSGSLYRRLSNHADHNPEYLFNGQRKRNGEIERLTVSGLNQMIHHTATKAGIKRRVWTHLFRHSMASDWIAKGGNPVTLQKILGHSTLAMISTVYSHLNSNDMYAEAVRIKRAPARR